ncbi:acyl-CoA thioesterase [Acetilactobacillus jinshanensis]|uniref:acyl-CoA thioesterase n=2 Tax=Bacteria TaxID=2 RepID=UPI001F473DF5|nr:acyl-CoA thioesterase [Acetilactobacillus jinshanensis]
MIKPYIHKVQYYETDKMGITNNTNYVRFMEEARNDYLAQINFPYSKFEDNGIISPVVKISCEYRKTTTYPDLIKIRVRILKVNRFKLIVGYVMTVKGQIVCRAKSSHCFMTNGRIINMEKQLPDFYRQLKAEEKRGQQNN